MVQADKQVLQTRSGDSASSGSSQSRCCPKRRPPRPAILSLAIRRSLPVALAVSGAVALGLSHGAQAAFPATVQLSALDGTNGFVLDGEAAGDRSGFSVSGAGDINGDGIDDLLIGAYGADPNSSSSGRSYVVFGRSAGFPATLDLSSLDGSNGFHLDGVALNDWSGYAVSAAGDVNGDGFDDILIGAFRADPNQASGSGSSYVVFGRDTGFPATVTLSSLDGSTGFRLDGVSAYDYSGKALDSAGDVNGDGFDDLLIGGYGADPGTNALSGSSYVVFGQGTGFQAAFDLGSLDGDSGFRLDGVATNDRSGRAVSAAGDVNGDGFDDVLIGAHGADPSGNYSGSSYLVFGQNSGFAPTLALSGLDGTNGFRLDGAAASDISGFSLSAAGDVNGDGFDDILIGAFGADPNQVTRAGSSYVVFGRGTGFPDAIPLSSLDGATGFRIDGTADDDRSGFAVSAAGDINGDGIDDILIGAYRRDANQMTRAGSSYVVFGRDTWFPGVIELSSLDGVTGFRLDGVAEYDFSGRALGSVGDVNGDGFDDLLIGAFGADPNGDGSGRSYVVFGGLTGPGEIPEAGLTPAGLDFGEVALATTAVGAVTLANIGTGTLEPGAITLSGAQAGDFSIEINNCAGVQLANGESCAIDIGFTPGAPGIRRATLRLESNAATSPDTVDLIGTNNMVFFDGFEDR